jgi:membrane-bound lytic murein transglycosylase D
MILLATLILAGIWAEPEGPAPVVIDRPLRGVQPQDTSPFPPPNSSSVSPAPHSLLTASALEQPLTKRYIIEYSSPGGIAWLDSVINNGSLYLPFIREEVSKRNLPPELLYLPVVESGFLASAKSRSGAVGLWQFMMNSIAPFGMKVNDLVDERRDFRKSTISALQKLEENYRSLGNWPLALAAYNTGLGGITRVVQRTKIRDYWQLCEKKELRNETIHYVPKLLAVSYILSQPRRFGLDYWPEAAAWAELPLGKQVSLDIIADETGADRELLRRLNMELLQGITPPDKTYRLKVPAAQAEQVAALLEREDFKPIHFHRYKVKYGDTVSALARYYQISIGLIEQHNPGILNRHLQIGETLTIPASQEAVPDRENISSGTKPPVDDSGNRPVQTSYLVKRGDTLWSLAVRYGVDPQILARENGMELNDLLPEGKTLTIPIIE